ncbi:MAG: 1-acyl-sn-glycerol-3-phosphate acyltransferase, partial [Fuerstiella sp.]|nr:1-acyl-sn-glycerol-3-phosphate acyltransferase [Fuerstiella sp.]
ERRLSWRTQDDMPMVERIYKVGNALLGLKETEYLGAPRPGHISDRLETLIDALLLPLEEEWLDSRSDESVINRVKKLRQAVVPDMISDNESAPNTTPLFATELDRRWRQLQDMQFAQALSLYPREYIASNPTVDRILETVQRMAENLSGKEQIHPPMKAIIQVGDPIPVAAKRERGADGDPVLNRLEASLTAMLEGLSRESKLCPDR